jgi:hypothetical protein
VFGTNIPRSDRIRKFLDCHALSNTLGIRTFDPKKKPTTFSLLTQLNEVFSPGLPEKVFLNLFRKCRVCHYTMTKAVFHHHTGLEEGFPSAVLIPDLNKDDAESVTESETESVN